MKILQGKAALFIVCAAFALSACGGGGSARDNTMIDPASSLYVSRTDLPPGDQCANGGVLINMGFDNNGNNVLDPREITNTEVICNGSDASSHPFVVYTNPQNNDTDAMPSAAISVVFNTDMDPSTINETTFTVKDENDTAVTGTVAYRDTVAVFTPAVILVSDTFIVTLDSSIKNILGVSLGYTHGISYKLNRIYAMASVPGGIYNQTDGTNGFTNIISPFRMAKCEVTYELWYTVYQWAVAHAYSFANYGTEGFGTAPATSSAAPTAKKHEPVTRINWRDAIVWCNAYSEMAGLTPVYCSDSLYTVPVRDSSDGDYGNTIKPTPGGFDKPYVRWNASGYRLPTEGEWQYAASFINGSSWTPYNHASGAMADYTYDFLTELVAWYGVNSDSVTHDVGGKAPNALDIYDMSGNAWEMCWDWWGTYPSGEYPNYSGVTSGGMRVMRGGSVRLPALNQTVGHRNTIQPFGEYDWGFRIVQKSAD